MKSRLIGKTFGVLKVIDFVRWDGRNQIYTCLCTRCNSVSEVRADHIFSGKSQSCTHCYHSLLGERTKQRYENKYNLTGEEYELAKSLNSSYLKFVNEAKARNLSFSITKDDAVSIMKAPCFYCGEPISMGIDRVDSSLGYTLENCVPCCGICNIMKKRFSSKCIYG